MSELLFVYEPVIRLGFLLILDWFSAILFGLAVTAIRMAQLRGEGWPIRSASILY